MDHVISEWLEERYMEWRVIPGSWRVKPQAEFARYLDEQSPNITRWLNKTPISYQKCVKLSAKLGDGIFAAAGYEKPTIGVDVVSDMADVVAETIATMSSHGITDINSPEGAKIINSILESRGLNKAK